MRQQRADHLKLHPVAIRQRRVRVPQPMRREVKADPPLRALDDLVDHRVGQRPPDLRRPTGSRTRSRSPDRRTPRACSRSTAASAPPATGTPPSRAALAARPPRRVLARADHDPPLPRHHVLMTQPQRLPDPHPRRRQQREQEPVTQPLAGNRSPPPPAQATASCGSDRRSGSRTARPRGRARAIPCRNGL